MNASDTDGVKFVSYQLRRVAYQWYDEWKVIRGEDVEPSIWENFSNAFLDHFFPRKLREAKVEDFVNLK